MSTAGCLDQLGEDAMTYENIVASTTEPAFSVDVNATILDWNEGAERLFGYTRAEAMGKPCCDLLRGCDVFGNTYCFEGCALIRMAQRHDAIHRCELRFRGASGQHIYVGVSTMVFPGESNSELAIVHLLCSLESKQQPTEMSTEALTAREMEILRILSDGKRTAQIAKQLKLSESTVRNHIQQILDKLKVHNRLEAVCVAWRTGLIEHVSNTTKP
jgi:PAS domain S-box-containing protein